MIALIAMITLIALITLIDLIDLFAPIALVVLNVLCTLIALVVMIVLIALIAMIALISLIVPIALNAPIALLIALIAPITTNPIFLIALIIMLWQSCWYAVDMWLLSGYYVLALWWIPASAPRHLKRFMTQQKRRKKLRTLKYSRNMVYRKASIIIEIINKVDALEACNSHCE